MKVQDIIVYVLVAGAVVFLLFKFVKPAFASKKKENCDTDCDCH